MVCLQILAIRIHNILISNHFTFYLNETKANVGNKYMSLANFHLKYRVSHFLN